MVLVLLGVKGWFTWICPTHPPLEELNGYCLLLSSLTFFSFFFGFLIFDLVGWLGVQLESVQPVAYVIRLAMLIFILLDCLRIEHTIWPAYFQMMMDSHKFGTTVRSCGQKLRAVYTMDHEAGPWEMVLIHGPTSMVRNHFTKFLGPLLGVNRPWMIGLTMPPESKCVDLK